MIPDLAIIIFSIIISSTVIYSAWIETKSLKPILYASLISFIILGISLTWLGIAYKERENQAVTMSLQVHEINNNGKITKGIFYKDKFYNVDTNDKSIIIVEYPKSSRGILFLNNSPKIKENK